MNATNTLPIRVLHKLAPKPNMPSRNIYSFTAWPMGRPGLDELPFAYYLHENIGVVDIWEHPVNNRGRTVKVVFLGFSEELTPSNGKLHLQGMLELESPLSHKSIASWIGTADVDDARNPDALFDYTRKVNDPTFLSGPYDYGVYKPLYSGQGKRTDWDGLADFVDGMAKERKSEWEISNAVSLSYPRIFICNSSGVTKLILTAMARYPHKKPELTELRPFQAHLMQVFASEPDDRTIHWVYDKKGNAGKSRFAAHLADYHNALILEGKKNDAAYLFQGQPIVIFDLARTQEDSCKGLYQLAENIKNGRVHSGKYVPVNKTTAGSHVVFFANFPPPEGTFSEDRIKLLDLETFSLEVDIPFM